MKCKDCPYYWADTETQEVHTEGGMIDYVTVEVTVAYCHYKDNDGCAPCEVTEESEED